MSRVTASSDSVPSFAVAVSVPQYSPGAAFLGTRIVTSAVRRSPAAMSRARQGRSASGYGPCGTDGHRTASARSSATFDASMRAFLSRRTRSEIASDTPLRSRSVSSMTRNASRSFRAAHGLAQSRPYCGVALGRTFSTRGDHHMARPLTSGALFAISLPRASVATTFTCQIPDGASSGSAALSFVCQRKGASSDRARARSISLSPSGSVSVAMTFAAPYARTETRGAPFAIFASIRSGSSGRPISISSSCAYSEGRAKRLPSSFGSAAGGETGVVGSRYRKYVLVERGGTFARNENVSLGEIPWMRGCESTSWLGTRLAGSADASTSSTFDGLSPAYEYASRRSLTWSVTRCRFAGSPTTSLIRIGMRSGQGRPP